MTQHLQVIHCDGLTVNNLCSTNETRIQATNSTIHMTKSRCPLVANITATDSAIVYVCATKAINAIVSQNAIVYYKGSLNHTQTSSGGQLLEWP
ncbi:unnamed protein product [Adineta ricciae]|uniref:Uncharacterized protein n=1 Tax=Adineta ricciae TaxID=249248 RepID=A0A814V628_ADIRI|nr:unnamed protein product [Adineta ricciae]